VQKIISVIEKSLAFQVHRSWISKLKLLDFELKDIVARDKLRIIFPPNSVRAGSAKSFVRRSEQDQTCN